jgi:SnoaL-like domain
MQAHERYLIIQEIADLLAGHWHDVDRNWGRSAHNDYTVDGSYTTSQRKRTGRDAIKEFYTGRHDRGERVARHLISNLHVTVHDANSASAIWVLSLHAADGAPILPSKPAIMIADVVDELVREKDGAWKYCSRTITPLFRDDTPTTG